MLKLRNTEWLALGFFAYVAVISPWFPRRPYLKEQPLVIFVTITGLFWLLAKAERVPSARVPVSLLRDILPIVTTLVAFKEMGYFQPLQFHHRYESVWVRWDDVVLRRWHLRSLLEGLGSAVPLLLEACYFTVYGVALVGVAVLYILRCRRKIDGFLSLYILGTLLAYSMFPYFPTEAPRIAYPGQDAPEISTWMREINLLILEKGTIHSAVFPSAHVSSAFSAAWGMFFVLPRRKVYGSVLSVYAAGVSLATVYGRYHYVADVLAGFAVSVVAAGLFAIARVWRRPNA